MAGTLVATTLSDGTNSTSTTNAIQGSAKAWVNFNGANGTRRASYNVSSVTRIALGTYTISFTNAFSDTSYTVNVNINNTTSGNGGQQNILSQATGSCTIETFTYNVSAWADFSSVYVVCMR